MVTEEKSENVKSGDVKNLKSGDVKNVKMLKNVKVEKCEKMPKKFQVMKNVTKMLEKLCKSE